MTIIIYHKNGIEVIEDASGVNIKRGEYDNVLEYNKSWNYEWIETDITNAVKIEILS